jgi:hypothetical protein
MMSWPYRRYRFRKSQKKGNVTNFDKKKSVLLIEKIAYIIFTENKDIG